MDINIINQRIEDIRIEMKFQYEKEAETYSELISLYEKAYEITKKVMYLIELCRVEKMMFSRTTNKAKSISKKAFQNHPMEKTLFFYLATHVVNGNFQLCMDNLLKAFENIKDPNLLAIKKLYEGGLHSVVGNYYLYNKLISEAKDEYDGGLYWQLESIVTEYDFGNESADFLTTKLDFSFDNMEMENKNYIFSLSADYVYFIKYFDFFYSSFKKTNPKGIIHVSLVNCSMKKHEVSRFLRGKQGVLVNYFDFSDVYDYRPISAVMRLLAIKPLLEKYQKPVFFGEIDCIVLDDLSLVIEELEKHNGSSQLVRVIGSYLPWQRYTCGFGLYLFSDTSLQAAELLNNYIQGIFNSTVKHWWMDQVALEASIRFSLLTNYRYRYYAPEMSFINKFVYTPVGGDAHEKKVFYLEQKLKDI